jgi:hypothetical protein
MSLAEGKEDFVNGMIELQQEMLSKEEDSFEVYAVKMADLIIALVKTAKVKSGISVSTTGTATAQTGTTTTLGTIE